MSEIGICGHGFYVPGFRIRAAEISRVWKGAPSASVMGVESKAVAQADEDSTTMGAEAGRLALGRSEIPAGRIGAIFFGSESKAYAVKPTSEMIAGILGLPPRHFSADLEFACKAGTTAAIACLALAKTGMVDAGIAIGSDCAQGAPGDALEYMSACGAAALIIGKGDPIATINSVLSHSTDTPDFWRSQREKYPTHTGRFTGDPSYFRHVVSAARALMEADGSKPADFAHVVFHQPNGVFPIKAAEALGFPREKLSAGLFVRTIGNVYSANTLLGISRTLDVAKRGERILAVSYGSGAGSDAFAITVRKDGGGRAVEGAPADVDYARYLVMRGKLPRGGEGGF